MNAILKTAIEEKISRFVFRSDTGLGTFQESERRHLHRIGRLMKFGKKQHLYTEGEPAKGVFILTKGKVKVWRLNSDGVAQIFFIYSEGEIFGHRPLLGNVKQPVTATCIEECEALFIEKEDFLNFMENSEKLRTDLVQSIGTEYSAMVNRINLFARSGIKERLAFFLLLLNETYNKPEQAAERASINLNRTDLAGYVGTSVENVVRMLKIFKQNGYIRTNRKSIYIENFDALCLISGI